MANTLILPKKLKGKVTKLEVEISIMIPSTKGIHTQQTVSQNELNERIDEVRAYLSSRFGGYTSVAASGGYTLKTGIVVSEPVTRVTAFANAKAAQHFKAGLLRKVGGWAKKWGQETIGLEWEGDLFLVPRIVQKKRR